MTSNRRLIEDFIPIREISAQAAREKSIRKGHISTLHLWWARRPLVAARAAVFASLVAAPENYQKRTVLKKTMIDLCRWEAGEPTIKDARKQILEAQRERLNLPSCTPLSEVPPPKVLDMFAGGGAIPLEALRLGCETYAIDLNPVAHIIELCTLVYPQKYGKKLALEVEKWGNWVIENVRVEIGDLYPSATLRVNPPIPSASLRGTKQSLYSAGGGESRGGESSASLRGTKQSLCSAGAVGDCFAALAMTTDSASAITDSASAITDEDIEQLELLPQSQPKQLRRC